MAGKALRQHSTPKDNLKTGNDNLRVDEDNTNLAMLMIQLSEKCSNITKH
jgi:hypothetical protein